MSIWRIRKVDAQTRALAEAAAKSAGVPLGVWLERAILQRVQNRQNKTAVTPAPPAAPSSDNGEQAAPALSTEMQSALEAAERRRHQRAGDAIPSPATPASATPAMPEPSLVETVASEPADPFAAPETVSDESPFEQPVEAMAEERNPVPALQEDEPVVLAADEAPPASMATATGTDDETVLPPPEEPVATAAAHTTSSHDDEPAILAPDDGVVTTPRREALVAAQTDEDEPRRRKSSLPLVAAGFVLAIAGAAAAYFLLLDRQAPPATETAAATPAPPAEPAPPTPAPASQPTPPQDATAAVAEAPPPPAPVPVPAPSPPAPQASEAPPPPAATEPEPAPTAAAPPPAVDLPRTSGPSIVNMAMSEAQPSAPPSPETTSAASAAQPAQPAPGAAESLPALIARAEAGAVDAQMELGRRYIEGAGVGRNQTEAAKWLLRAAEQGDAQAQFNVGVMYERGVGVAADLSKALDFYRKSAAQNTPMALHNLALLHSADQPGMKANPVQARRLMTQAAELGQIESQYSLALMHLQGIGGPVDRVAAMSWLALAARPSQPRLIENARQLSAQLSPAERQRAEQMAEGHVRKVRANLQKLQAGESQTATAPATDTPARPQVIDRLAITEMQKLLAALKLYTGAPDGVMGPRTAAAIREFQEMAGLPVDGRPSVELLERLNEVAGMVRQ